MNGFYVQAGGNVQEGNAYDNKAAVRARIPWLGDRFRRGRLPRMGRGGLLMLLVLLLARRGAAQEKIGFVYKFRPITTGPGAGFVGGEVAARFRLRPGTMDGGILTGLFVVRKPVGAVVASPYPAPPPPLLPTAYSITRDAVPANTPALVLESRRIQSRKLVGELTGKNGDTLFLKFRSITPITTPNSPFNAPGVVNDQDNDADFAYIVPATGWVRPWGGRGLFRNTRERFKLHFVYTSLAATAIPLRVGLFRRPGETTSEFPAGSVAVFRVWGYSNIYRTAPLDKASYRVFGLGPFIGPTRTVGEQGGKEIGRLVL